MDNKRVALVFALIFSISVAAFIGVVVMWRHQNKSITAMEKKIVALEAKHDSELKAYGTIINDTASLASDVLEITNDTAKKLEYITIMVTGLKSRVDGKW